MRKAIFYSALFIIVSVIGISIGFKVVNNKKIHNIEFEYTTQMGKNPVTDECVEEGQAFLQANENLHLKLLPEILFQKTNRLQLE